MCWEHFWADVKKRLYLTIWMNDIEKLWLFDSFSFLRLQENRVWSSTTDLCPDQFWVEQQLQLEAEVVWSSKCCQTRCTKACLGKRLSQRTHISGIPWWLQRDPRQIYQKRLDFPSNQSWILLSATTQHPNSVAVLGIGISVRLPEFLALRCLNI